MTLNWFLSMLQKCNSVIFAGELFRRPVVSKSKNTSVLIINGTVEYLEDILTTNKHIIWSLCDMWGKVALLMATHNTRSPSTLILKKKKNWWRRRYFNETFWGFMTYKKVVLLEHIWNLQLPAPSDEKMSDSLDRWRCT